MSVSSSVEDLAVRLLHRPVSDPIDPEGPACAPGRKRLVNALASIVMSAFIAFHVTTLLVYATPTDSLTMRVKHVFDQHLEMTSYIAITGNQTRWDLFAPNPPRANFYTRVLVEDVSGHVHDMRHDMFGRRRYPYLFYDRLRKINDVALHVKEYRVLYAAWQCREWERAHGGEAAARVRLVRFMTRIPAPDVTYATGGYEPTLLDTDLLYSQPFECQTIPHGQLPPALRARHGLPPATEGSFINVEFNTWRQRVPSDRPRQ